jgi:hypothetical protein
VSQITPTSELATIRPEPVYPEDKVLQTPVKIIQSQKFDPNHLTARVIGLLLMVGAICACRVNWAQPVEVEAAKTPDSSIRSATFPSSKDSSPTELFTTSMRSVFVKTGDITPTDRFQRSLYLWEPGKQPKLIVSGHFLDVIRLSNNEFAAAWYSKNSENSPVEFVTLNAQGNISQPLLLPPSGPTGWGGCGGNTRYVACVGNLPEMKADDKDYDEMGFSAVLVIDLEKQKTSWFPVKHQTLFHFDAALKRIYVSEDQDHLNLSSSVESFDLGGNALGEAHVLDMTLSPSGHFADSLQEDGADSWEVYDVASKRVLLSFGCDKPGCKRGDRQEGHYWNPVLDGQFVALRMGGGTSGMCDVYQAATARLVKSVSCGGLAVFDWSRDGRELITIKYEGGEYRRELINEATQNRSPR